MKFYIVNNADRPCPELVAYETKDGNLNYLDSTKSAYNGMPKDRATPIEDFGITVTIGDQSIHFNKERKSRAAYYDGTPRNWQGECEFSHAVPGDAA